MHLSFDWNTSDMSILLLAKVAKPIGTARIVINSLHIKGDVCKATSFSLIPCISSSKVFFPHTSSLLYMS